MKELSQTSRVPSLDTILLKNLKLHDKKINKITKLHPDAQKPFFKLLESKNQDEAICDVAKTAMRDLKGNFRFRSLNKDGSFGELKGVGFDDYIQYKKIKYQSKENLSLLQPMRILNAATLVNDLAIEQYLSEKKTGLFFIKEDDKAIHIDPLIVHQGHIYMLQSKKISNDNNILENVERKLKNIKSDYPKECKESKIFTLFTPRNTQGKLTHYQGDAYSCGIIGMKLAKKLLQNDGFLWKKSLKHDDNTFMIPPSCFQYNQSLSFKTHYENAFKEKKKGTALTIENENFCSSSDVFVMPVNKSKAFLSHIKHFNQSYDLFKKAAQKD